MSRLIEALVAAGAICGIAGFLGLRAAVRKTLRTLGRDPDQPRDWIEEEVEHGDRDGEASHRDRAGRVPGAR